MSIFSDAINAAFDEAVNVVGDTISKDGKTARCIRTLFPQEVEYELNGKQLRYNSEIEIKRTEAQRLGIVNRSDVVIDGKTLKVVRIDDDAADPILKLVIVA